MMADDHWLARAGLKRLLRRMDGQAVVLEASNFHEALEIASDHTDLDLLLLDLMMPDMSAFEGLATLRKRLPHVPIVVISIIEDRREILRAIEAGAMGYIPKTAKPDEIVEALQKILSGNIFLPRQLLGAATEPSLARNAEWQSTHTLAAERFRRLTKRQREVLELLRTGRSNTEISENLGLSKNTVRLHLAAIFERLEVKNRTQAALLAAQFLDNNLGEKGMH